MNLLNGLDISAPANPIVKEQSAKNIIGDLFGNTTTSPITTSALKVYEKNGLLISIEPKKESSTSTILKAIFSSTENVKKLQFLVAVPKVI